MVRNIIYSSLTVVCLKKFISAYLASSELIQDLEDALGQLEFTNGVPDIKFSRVRIMYMLMNSVVWL